jgi:hypothetical protein
MTRPMISSWFPNALYSDIGAIIIIASLIAAWLIIAALVPDTPSLGPITPE